MEIQPLNPNQIRLNINKYLDEVDEGFLKVVHAMLDAYVQQQKKEKQEDVILGYDIEGKPKYANTMQAIYDKEVKAAIEQKEYTTLDDLEKEIKTW